MGSPPTAELPAALRRLVERVRSGAMQEWGNYAAPPPDGSGRPSAVLIVFSPVVSGSSTTLSGSDGLSVLLIERASQLRAHAGQVAFPGGAVDPGDADPVATALREAQEEVGLDPSAVQILGELPELFILRSGFRVTPVLAWWPTPVPLRPVDTGEVARVATVQIADLADPANRFRAVHPSGYTAPAFEVQSRGVTGGEFFIWGFTANVLATLLEVAGWALPWNPEVLRALPESRL